MTGANIAPIVRKKRLRSIDALRGFALLGIIVVNAPFFGLTVAESISIHITEISQADYWVAMLTRLFAEQKFISIFSLLFGVGLAIQYQRAVEKGVPFYPFAYRRLFVLGCFGIAHVIFLWYGDVLISYALIGAILVLLLGLRAQTLMILGGLCLIVPLLCSPSLHFLESINTSDNIAYDQTLRGFDAMKIADFNLRHENWMIAERDAYANGPLQNALLFRLVTWIQITLIMSFSFGWNIASMFLFGAGLWKLKFFDDDSPAARWRGALLLLAIPGVALEWFYTWPNLISDNTFVGMLAKAGHQFGSTFLALSMTSLFTILAARNLIPGTSALSALGRMSLTAYLLETIAFAIIMSWWGYGKFGTFGRFELLLIALGIYLAILLLCIIWQRFASIGPAEWLWRTLAYLRAPAWKTRPIASNRSVSD